MFTIRKVVYIIMARVFKYKTGDKTQVEWYALGVKQFRSTAFHHSKYRGQYTCEINYPVYIYRPNLGHVNIYMDACTKTCYLLQG